MSTNTVKLGATLLAAATAAIFALPAMTAAPGRDATVVTITAVGKKDAAPPNVNKDDAQLTLGKERKPIAAWTKADRLYLAVLIDDSLDSSVASQFGELKEFLNSQPATTSVAVFYARNATAMVVQDFTTDHALAAEALRIPLGGTAALSSPYLALQDLMKRWPSTGDRRSILLVSSGIDFFRGDFSTFSPDLDSTIERAQKGNINIWSIYSPSSGHRSRSLFRVNNAQSNLSKLSEETGGETYYLGVSSPVSFKPYLDEIQLHLKNQYLLAFLGTGGPKGKFTRLRVNTELPEMEFLAPSQVFLPPAR